jgi:hypothetical protein
MRLTQDAYRKTQRRLTANTLDEAVDLTMQQL